MRYSARNILVFLSLFPTILYFKIISTFFLFTFHVASVRKSKTILMSHLQ